MSEERIQGHVIWFDPDRGYGFISRDDDPNPEDPKQHFAHFSYVDMDGYKTLTSGQKVSFVVVDHEKGLQAQNIVVEE